jgi:hypothetical protein
MKRTLIALVASIFMGAPNTIQAHGDRAFHYNDVARILNGFGTPDYKDAKNALSELTQGTTEWAEAIQKANHAGIDVVMIT